MSVGQISHLLTTYIYANKYNTHCSCGGPCLKHKQIADVVSSIYKYMYLLAYKFYRTTYIIKLVEIVNKHKTFEARITGLILVLTQLRNNDTAACTNAETIDAGHN